MDAKQLRERSKCAACSKPVGHTGLPLFWTIKIERHGVLMDAVRRFDGLAAMFNGSAALADAMTPERELTQPMMEPVELTICEACATERPLFLAALAELGPKDEGQNDGLPPKTS